MENNEAILAPYYVGDFLSMKDNNDDLEFVYPEEGVNYFVDAMCIPTSANNKKAAEACGKISLIAWAVYFALGIILA